jgi:hypothetical protein
MSFALRFISSAASSGDLGFSLRLSKGDFLMISLYELAPKMVSIKVFGCFFFAFDGLESVSLAVERLV